MKVQVLGSGCANCERTAKLIAQVASERNVSIELAKVTDIQEIMRFGVMSTPAVVIDGTVVHAGGLPSPSKVEGWLAGAGPAAAPAAPSAGAVPVADKAAARCCG